MDRPADYEEAEEAPESAQAPSPEEEPESEPWRLSRGQAEHLRQVFPHFREQPLTTSSDVAFAAWLQQGMEQ